MGEKFPKSVRQVVYRLKCGYLQVMIAMRKQIKILIKLHLDISVNSLVILNFRR